MPLALTLEELFLSRSPLHRCRRADSPLPSLQSEPALGDRTGTLGGQELCLVS